MTDGSRIQPITKDRMDRPLPKRFYKTVEVSPEFGIKLDGRPVRTPVKRLLTLPTNALAQAVASEWEDQSTVVNPASMPLTKLSNTAIDRVQPERDQIVSDIVSYAGSDLVCYRAEEPLELVNRQAEVWNPVIDWAHLQLDARFEIATGVMHRPQPEEALSAVRQHLLSFNHWELTALHNLTTLTGSALLAIMINANAISPESAWAAAHIDEDWQIEQWGQDEEAQARRDIRSREFTDTVKFLTLTRTAE